jgi:hypothetical protein
VFLYKKYKNTAVRHFILFLFAIVFVDFLGGYTYYVVDGKFLSFLIGTKFEKNHWLYTLSWDIGAVVFFSFYYNLILDSKIFKTSINIFLFLFVVFSIVYIYMNWDAFFNQLFIPIFVFGALIILKCAVFYFIEILQSDKILIFYKSVNFYISFVIFVWWLVITPITFYDIYHHYIVGSTAGRDMNYFILRNEIFLFANMFMYLTYTFALIWCRPEKN